MNTIQLGCIADDFTGATDLANNLVRAGLRVVQVLGVPSAPLDCRADAVVVALKSRTCLQKEAIDQSLAALRWLQAQGAQQIYFKYCSTFDSTPAGNIGAVTEALMDALAGSSSADLSIACPAFPDNQRTLFNGHLFVGDALLSESGMQNHPLTPMTDSNLVRVLQAQCRRKVALIDYQVVAQGAAAIRSRMDALRAQGVALALVDAISNADLLRLGPALKGLALVTGGSGVALGLAANFELAPGHQAAALPAAKGLQALLSGSCSQATNRQVQAFIQAGRPALAIDPLQVAAGVTVVQPALDWAARQMRRGPVLIYCTAPAARVQAVQVRLGARQAGALLEQTLAAIACGLLALGVRQLIVAGGETAGACVQALGITQMQIGAQIDPGVPWCYAQSKLAPDCGLHLALKSGNFGSDDFFSKSFALLS